MKTTGQFWNIKSASWYATIRTYIEKMIKYFKKNKRSKSPLEYKYQTGF